MIADVAHSGSKTGNKYFFMTQDGGSPGPAIKEFMKLVCSMRPEWPITDGVTIGNDSVRAYVVEAKK